jgi:hypothetical protein
LGQRNKYEEKLVSIYFNDIKNLRLKDIPPQIAEHDKLRIGDLKVLDLVRNGDEAEECQHGIYLFFDDENRCLYVGKNSSQQFIERIPAHFAQSDNSWFNHFIKYFKRSRDIQSYSDATIAAESCKLALILIPEGKKVIAKIESILRSIMTPQFNSIKKRFDEEQTLLSLL